jgi:hypothetical protein
MIRSDQSSPGPHSTTEQDISETKPLLETRLIPFSPASLQTMKTSSLYTRLQNQFFRSSIMLNEKSILITAPSKQYVLEIETELMKLRSRMEPNPYARWAILSRQGYYELPSQSIIHIIEHEYTSYYLKLSSPEYVQFSHTLLLDIGELQFDRTGGIHRIVVMENTEMIIFPVKRQCQWDKFQNELIEDYFWQWRSNVQGFIAYSEENSYLIEQAYKTYQKTPAQMKCSLLILASDLMTYRIRFDKMQQINEKTSFAREIKRFSGLH